MRTAPIGPMLTQLFAELIHGATNPGGAFILNSGDIGLLRSLDRLSADDASRALQEGGTIAAHAEHVRYGLSLMNRWALDGGNPFADATWDAAWKIAHVGPAQWDEIRTGLRTETERWLEVLRTPREVSDIELTGMIASLAHFAYHVGAIRQISRDARGPKQGTFSDVHS